MKQKSNKGHKLLLPEYALSPFDVDKDQEQVTFDFSNIDSLTEMYMADVAAESSLLFPTIDGHQAEKGHKNEETQISNADEPAKAPRRRSTAKSEKVSEYEVASYLAANFDTGLFEGCPYVKQDGVHVPLDARLVGCLIENSMRASQKTAIQGKAFSSIEAWLRAILDGENRVIRRHPTRILFQNGCFDYATGEKVNPGTDFFPVRINASFRPQESIETPVFDDFIQSISPDENVQRLILEYLGYEISPAKPTTIFLLAPVAGSGKSVLGNFCRDLLGKRKTCSISIQNFGNSFELAQIFGKSGVFCLDISSAVLSDATTAVLKRLSGGTDTETINAKYQLPFPYENYAKLTFACNEGGLRLRNPDSGFERRLVVIPFMHAVRPQDMDRNLPEKLWAERDGIVLKAVDALRDLHKRNYVFTSTVEGEKLKRKFLGIPDKSVQDFLDDVCTLSPDVRMWINDLYKAYVAYCLRNELTPVSSNAFSRRIRSAPGVRPAKWQEDHVQLRGIEGISLK